ncbi:MAG: hypothetical protein IKI93_12330, partial [Clostridia bacterium]|nr:hypothetical protein [Clostridia bacterium]
MAENRNKQDELNRLAEEIRKNVRERVRLSLTEKGIAPADALPEDVPAVEMEVDSLSAVDRVSRTSDAPEREEPSDSFWDLGKPKPKVYAKPDFAGHSLAV